MVSTSPRPRTITSAEVRFTAQDSSSGALTLRVRGVLAPASLDFVEDDEGSGSGLLSDAYVVDGFDLVGRRNPVAR